MHRQRTLVAFVACVVALLVGIACGEHSQRARSVEVVASIGSALGAADVDRVMLTVTREAPSHVSLVTELTKVGVRWQATVDDIPVGSVAAGNAWTFRAEAFGAGSDVALFRGEAGNVEVSSTGMPLVVIVMQEVAPPPPFDDAAPLITSIAASGVSIARGDTVHLVAGAYDPNPTDALVFAWSAVGPGANTSVFSLPSVTTEAGTSTKPAQATTDWTPSVSGSFTIALVVTDRAGARAGVSFTLDVTGGNSASSSSGTSPNGDADIAADVNTWPIVRGMGSSNPRPLEATENPTTSLTVNAFDGDGDAISVAWSASPCSGDFSPSAAEAAVTFRRTDTSPLFDCTFTAEVRDVHGGSNVGSLKIRLGSNPSPVVRP